MVDSASSHHPSRLQLVTEKLVRRKSRSSMEVTLSPDELEHLQHLAHGGSESDAEDSDSAVQTSSPLDLRSSSPPALKLPPRPSSRQGFSLLPTIPHSPGPSLGLTGSSSGGYAEFGPSVEETDNGPADNGSSDIASSSGEEEDDEVWTEEPTATSLSVSGAILPVKPLPSYQYRDCWDGSFLPPGPGVMGRPNRTSLGSDTSVNISVASSQSCASMLNRRLSTDSTPQRRLSTPHMRPASASEVVPIEDTDLGGHEGGSSVDSPALHSAPQYHRERLLSCSALGPLIRTLDLSSNCLASVDGLCDARVFRRLNALKDLDLKHNKLDCLNEDLFKVRCLWAGTAAGWPCREGIGRCRQSGCVSVGVAGTGILSVCKCQ